MERQKLSLIAALVILLALPAHAEVRVIDGDTMDVDGVRVRLHGIDAPEGKQSCQREGVAWLCGQEAAKALREHVRGKELACETKDRDRYGRAVAVCRTVELSDFIGKLPINDWMVRQGWALDYRQYSKGAYADAEREAREGKRGLWAGTFTPPWEWRRKNR